jgi:hypothetical protein
MVAVRWMKRKPHHRGGDDDDDAMLKLYNRFDMVALACFSAAHNYLFTAFYDDQRSSAKKLD